ncbi:MAG: hypothetical protein PHV18_11305 [Lachnospiraceae bacterium]|nr:hypothetical protein [Lachnospiraceae bacterium]
MIRRICPTCDQVMNSAHYCKTCKQWVKHPYVRDVTYYLNEQHAAAEKDCSYHNSQQNQDNDAAWKRRAMQGQNPAQPAGSGSSRTQQTQTAWVPRNDYRGSKAAGSAAAAEHDRAQAATSAAATEARNAAKPVANWTLGRLPRERSGKNKVGLIILVIFVTVKLLDACSAYVTNAAYKLMSEIPENEYDIDLGNFSAEEEYGENGFTELTDAEAKEGGIACTDCAHFPLNGRELEEPMKEVLLAHGLEVKASERYSMNETYGDGTSWFATWINYDLANGPKNGYQYAELDYDTATEEVHSISITVEDPATLAEVTGAVLELMEEKGGLSAGESCADQVRQELSRAVEQENGYQLKKGLMMVEGVCYDNSYSITISPVYQEE